MDVQAYLYETNQVVVQYETRMYAKMRETYQNTKDTAEKWMNVLFSSLITLLLIKQWRQILRKQVIVDVWAII